MKLQITLAAARVNAGYNQLEAADLIGITPKTLRNYEKGVTSIPGRTLRKAAKVYGVPDDFIKLPIVDDGEYDEKFLNYTTV